MSRAVSEFLAFIEFEKRYSIHTLLSYKNDLEQFSNFFKKETNSENISEASHFHIRNWMVHLMQTDVGARSISRKISTLKSFYKFLIRKGVISKSPMGKIQSPKIKKRLPSFVEDSGMTRLFRDVEFTDDFNGWRDQCILALLYATGIRRSELLGLSIQDIDFNRLQIKVLGKGNKERIIPITADMGQQLKDFIKIREMQSAAGSHVFIMENGAVMKPHTLYNLVKKYLSQVTTIEKKSPHVLRHTFATHLMNNGADINAVKELLGHSSLAATQVYTHNTIEKLRNIYKQAHPRA
ncbi:MAG: site-specific tyrosine recombinase/integron integrase [Chitinophagales bacterium]